MKKEYSLYAREILKIMDGVVSKGKQGALSTT